MYLRNRPVDRDEVVIRDYQILTLPAEVCPPDRDDRYGWPTVIQGLVEPLFNEIKAEGEAALRDLKTHMVNEKMPTLGSHYVAEILVKREQDWKTHFPLTMWAYRECRRCGRKFAYDREASRLRYCSNACIDAAKLKTRSQKRTKRRAFWRNNKCAHCGAAMEAHA